MAVQPFRLPSRPFILFTALCLITTMVASFAMSGRPARAANTYTVITLNDDAPGVTCPSFFCYSLRDALNTAANGDTIQFMGNLSGSQVITLSHGTLTIATSVTIQGPTTYSLAIDGGNAATVFTINSGVTAAINGLTIQHGRNYQGGGIQNSGTLSISNCNFVSSVAFFGSGGGTQGDGAAIFNTGTLTINSSTFSNNIGANNGGALTNDGGSVTVTTSTFTGNQGGNGGALYNFNTGHLVVSNSTLYNNLANASGGALYNASGTLVIGNDTIANNLAYVDGGGFYNNGSAGLELLSTILANNSAGAAGPEAYISGGVQYFTAGYNLIRDDSGSSLIPTTGDQFGAPGSLIDPMLGTLANNGGPTQTMAITSSSLAYQAGNCGGTTGFPVNAPSVSTDQRGLPRKVIGVGCDVGAYEAPALPTATPTNTPTNTPTTTPTSTSIPAKIDTIGIFRAGTFYLRLHNSTGNADLTVPFTAGTKPYPVVGDWTSAGFDTVGIFDQNNGQFSLRDSNTAGTPDQQFVLGNPSDQPLAGRWQLTATNAGVGVFRPSNGLIYLKNALSTGYADYTMVLGIPGDVGLAGDWNGKGFDSPGVYRPGNSTFYLSNQVTNGSVYGDYQFAYGLGGDAPVAGDWVAQGHDGVGLFRQSNGFTYLKNQLVTGYADTTFTYGIAGDVPVAGHWQSVYPPIAPAPILIAKTAVPATPNGSISVPGGNQIGG